MGEQPSGDNQGPGPDAMAHPSGANGTHSAHNGATIQASKESQGQAVRVGVDRLIAIDGSGNSKHALYSLKCGHETDAPASADKPTDVTCPICTALQGRESTSAKLRGMQDACEAWEREANSAEYGSRMRYKLDRVVKRLWLARLDLHGVWLREQAAVCAHTPKTQG